MTSNELKYQAKMQGWGLAIQDRRSHLTLLQTIVKLNFALAK